MKKTLAAKLVNSFAISLLCGVLTFPVSSSAESVKAPSATVKVDSFPCDGIIQPPNEKDKADIERAIAKQTKVSSPVVVRSFKYGGWSIFFVEPYVFDAFYLFYSGNPLTNRYVKTWSGWSDINEESKVNELVLKNVPGIPPALARCFAWETTKGPLFPKRYPMNVVPPPPHKNKP